MKTGFFRAIGVLVLTAFLAACNRDFLKVGDSAPNFSLPAADGSTISLSDYEDRPVLLFFHMALG